MVNLSDKIPGSLYFTWKEALWLPQWNRAATEDELTEEIKQNIISTARWMDAIRAFFGAPIVVHCWLRPDEYNKLVGGAKSSMHRLGKAVDFHVKGIKCDAAKQKLLNANMLENLNLRMEDIQGEWVHLDDRAPGPSGRFFKP
jgi:hypothetical protein